ncbi:xanthine dehydrogenase family protein molybdopterin-binding subunit [Streptomyces sp. YU58]|uniref:xanthine dehydrogenase family protein molybdopterin-binding subunit n=1 Tax=Streptomyces sp. SX92 TaxID=3158972 RepID=UPI0027BB212C|nr:xanthine dehydrogenase family protein molybdopterin-binding subunit [Streptomyces coralus]WLW57018.1 xanthine dehydrogenase family protein molybdopterin-binding subunit [Streptomyces coralus]
MSLSNTSSMDPQPRRHVGARTPRREDSRLLRGQGSFVDDIDITGQLFMRVVRASVAHARITSIDASAARDLPGVHLVLTGEDVRELGPVRLEELGYHDLFPHLEEYSHPVLPTDRVLYVGQPVAAVIAEDPYLAEDAAELVEVDYEELPVVLDPVEAVSGGASLHVLGNEPASFVKEYGQVERAFAEAAHVVRGEFRIGRHSGIPMETRGFVVEPVPGRDQLWVWGAVHVHDCRRIMARMLGMPLTSIRMRHTDIGGNFGVRGGVFAEHLLVAHAARKLGRPVKWIEDRVEHMVAIAHAREQVHRMEGAFDAEGRLLALRDEIWHNHGAFLRQAEPLVSDITAGMVVGPYRIPAYRAELHAVITNKTPLAAYRAPGRYEGTFARERLFDLAAQEIGIDPVELRLRNVLTASDLPWEPGLEIAFEPYLFNSGDVLDHMRKALDAADYEAWREEARRLREEGRIVGNGIGLLMDKAGLGLYETADVEVDGTGRVRVLTGASSVGQGIETVLAQIVADELGVDPQDIDVMHGDTDLVPDGVGSWSSRSTVLAGGAARAAAQKALAKAVRVAGRLLEVDTTELQATSGRIEVVGKPDQYLTLAQIAERWDGWSARAVGDEPGLHASAVYLDEHMNYPYGITLVQLEIDPTTGGHTIRRFFVSTEAGKMINPLTTEGQIIGAAAQGIGGALFEEFQYDEQGQPLSTSFMDYLLPGAGEVPSVQFFVTEDAPTPDNPLGAKGLGEVGLIAVGAAVAGAIDDALGGEFRVRRIPVHPQDLFELSREAGER